VGSSIAVMPQVNTLLICEKSSHPKKKKKKVSVRDTCELNLRVSLTSRFKYVNSLTELPFVMHKNPSQIKQCVLHLIRNYCARKIFNRRRFWFRKGINSRVLALLYDKLSNIQHFRIQKFTWCSFTNLWKHLMVMNIQFLYLHKKQCLLDQENY
jgi:hypothetical protein